MAKTIFMFHAIGDLASEDWADPHYSYGFNQFTNFLEKIGEVTSLRNCISGNSKSNTILTFDDGHESNYMAAKHLYANKLGTADFFINPDHVGTDYYMTWEQIKELNDLGMSIQSHGLDHKYLSDCDDVELHRQLLESKRTIEKNVGNSVTILAPPGGRYDSRIEKLAKAVGYSVIANSKPGHISKKIPFFCPRIAVLKSDSVEDLLGYTSRFSKSISFQIIKYHILRHAKKILGNQRYEKWRWKLLGDQ